jgi:large subunit ribosomal protein L19
MDKMKMIEEQNIKGNVPQFGVGDTVKVMTKIAEGDKTRLHPFEGVIIALKRHGIRSSFTVRRISFGEGVERVFPFYSPNIERIEVLKRAKAGRSKLYYLRGRIGKAATKVEEAK